MEKMVDGKMIRMISDNIMIIPNQVPLSSIEKEVNYVFSNPASTERIREVYKILTQ